MSKLPPMKELGQAVREARQAANLTLEELTLEMQGYDSSNLSRFERGKQAIDLSKLDQLAHILKTTVSELQQRAEALANGAPPLKKPPNATPEVSGGLRVEEPLGPLLAQRATTPAVDSDVTARHIARQGVRFMPVLSDLEAAQPRLTTPHAGPTIAVADGEYSAAAFAWRVPDDTMTADGGSVSFARGVYVIFEPTNGMESGDCALVRIDAATVQFAQLTRMGSSWFMTPLNRRFGPTPLPAGAQVIGVAVAAHWRVPRGGATR